MYENFEYAIFNKRLKIKTSATAQDSLSPNKNM